MTNYNQIRYGSRGNDVTELQKLLNQNGYSLAEDGIFGSNTQAAVKDYQQNNGLTVDGIVGNNTWGSLTKTQSAQSPSESGNSSTSVNTPATPQQPAYQPSEAVNQAQQLLSQQLAQQPGQYNSQWGSQLNDAIQQILGRESFSYDVNADALYQQYKDQYVNMGKLAMMDTMGQAQAATGGYGNSYAQSVGQQAYQGYLQQLNDRIPELYQLALDRYQMEGDQLADQYSILAGLEEQEYGRYSDALSQWLAERDYLAGRLDTERGYDYQQYRDLIGDQQWQAEFDEAKRQYDQQYALKTAGGSGGSSTYVYRDTEPAENVETPEEKPVVTGYNNQGYSEDIIRMAQELVGAEKTGRWTDADRKLAEESGYYDLQQVVNAMNLTGNAAAAQSGSGNTGAGKATDRTAAVIRQIDDTYQREKDSGNLTAYNSRILDMIERRLSAGTLDEDEAQYLMNYYRLWDLVD